MLLNLPNISNIEYIQLLSSVILLTFKNNMGNYEWLTPLFLVSFFMD